MARKPEDGESKRDERDRRKERRERVEEKFDVEVDRLLAMAEGGEIELVEKQLGLTGSWAAILQAIDVGGK